MRSVRKGWAVIGGASLVCLSLACTTQLSNVSPNMAPNAVAVETPALNAMTYFAHGHLLERQGNFKRAAQQYREALDRQPKFSTAKNRLGITLNKLGRHAEASQIFREAISANPDRSHLHNNLGFSLLLEDHYTQAEGVLARALELNPAFRRARMNLGLVLAKLGRFEEAFDEFAGAGSDADAYYNLAMVQAEAGMYEQACTALRRTLELRPKMKSAAAQLERWTARVVESDVRLANDGPQETGSAIESRPVAPISPIAPSVHSVADEPRESAAITTNNVRAVAEEATIVDTDMSAALDRAFERQFGEEDAASYPAAVAPGIETLERPAAKPLDATPQPVQVEPDTSVDVSTILDFAWPLFTAAADAVVERVEFWADEIVTKPIETAPISLADAVAFSAESDFTAGDEAEPATREREAAEVEPFIPELEIIESSAPPAATTSSMAVQDTIHELLVEAEYLAELMFAIHDELEPERAFELACEIEAIISTQLSEVALLDEWRCELLDEELSLEAVRGD